MYLGITKYTQTVKRKLRSKNMENMDDKKYFVITLSEEEMK
jgi:hypothetical protein